MLFIENSFKHVHEMGGRKYELYTWSYHVVNWYHWILSIGINIDILLYTHILFFLYMYAWIYQLKLIQFEMKAYIHKNIWVYKKIVNIDTNWKSPMIPIETIIRSSVYLIILSTHFMHMFKRIFNKEHTRHGRPTNRP